LWRFGDCAEPLALSTFSVQVGVARTAKLSLRGI
jgi:hypothetical protein